MGLEDLPDLTKKYGKILKKNGWDAVAEHLKDDNIQPIEIAEFGIDGLYEIGYVFGTMKFNSTKEKRIIYSRRMCSDEEDFASSSCSINDQNFEYHLMKRK